MKRCPQCNTVFENEKTFCTEDGTSLVDEAFSMPSDFTPEDHDDGEQETVMRYKPLNFDISNPSIPQEQTQVSTQTSPQVNPYAPNHGNAPPQPPAKQSRGCLKYSLVLVIGLMIGGGVALGIVGAGFYYWNKISNENRIVSNTETAENTPTKKTNSNKSNKKPRIKHSEPNIDIDDAKLNGRIIKRRANLRSSPRNSAKRIDRLPRNDRIEIIRRKSSTSKWYEIKCEHGSRGWIDGFSIEFAE